MKKIALLFACMLLLTSCAAEPTEYVQRILPKPERIEVQSGTECIFYSSVESNYEKIFEAISQNWWKTAEGETETAASDALEMVSGLKELKTTTKRTYVSVQDTIICFRYDNEPAQWTTPAGEVIEIKRLAFVLPEKTETTENVRGIFTVSKTDSIGVNEGVYTYYFAPELVSDFWEFLKQ